MRLYLLRGRSRQKYAARFFVHSACDNEAIIILKSLDRGARPWAHQAVGRSRIITPLDQESLGVRKRKVLRESFADRRYSEGCPEGETFPLLRCVAEPPTHVSSLTLLTSSCQRLACGSVRLKGQRPRSMWETRDWSNAADTGVRPTIPHIARLAHSRSNVRGTISSISETLARLRENLNLGENGPCKATLPGRIRWELHNSICVFDQYALSFSSFFRCGSFLRNPPSTSCCRRVKSRPLMSRVMALYAKARANSTPTKYVY